MRFKKAVAYSIAVGGFLGIGTVGFLNRDALAKEAHNWHVLPQPERLTELYFTDPHKIPRALAGEQTLAFTVHNLEHQTTTYTYAVLAKSTDADEVEYKLGEGTFTLNQDASQVTNQDITIPSLPGRTAIHVILSYKDPSDSVRNPRQQSIHYWVEADNLGDSTE